MKTESAQAAPLESFPNSPCHYYAQHIQPGVYVEVLNPDGQGNLKNDSNAYWFAEIKERYGLKIKVSYLGCRGKLELWLNATDVYPVGFCISENKKQMAKMKIEKMKVVRKSGVPKSLTNLPVRTSKPASTTSSVFQKPEPPKQIKNQKPYTPRHQLVPPQEVLDNHSPETIHELIMQLANYPTLPADFHLKTLPKQPIEMGDRLEIVDKCHIGCMRVAYINDCPLPGGRIRLRYEDSLSGNVEEFWANIHSSIVHPIGWSKFVGHKIILGENKDQNYIRAPVGFKNASNEAFTFETMVLGNYRKVKGRKFGDDDGQDSDQNPGHSQNPEAFQRYRQTSCKKNASSSIVIIDNTTIDTTTDPLKISETVVDNTTEKGAILENSQKVNLQLLNHSSGSDENNNCESSGFEVGMKLEAIDPLHLSCICPATVVKVLKRGFLMVSIDGSTYKAPMNQNAGNQTKPTNENGGTGSKNSETDPTHTPPPTDLGKRGTRRSQSVSQEDKTKQSNMATTPIQSPKPGSNQIGSNQELPSADSVNIVLSSDPSKTLEKHDNIFCYHSKSSSIMPAGFCELAGIKLTTPTNMTSEYDTFTWAEYMQKNRGSKLAPPHLFSNRIPRHTFGIGDKLEAVDLMEPSLVCVATVKQVAGRLLRIGFDGWGDEYDQWVDCYSSDIYPCGYCELVRQTLQPPRGYTKQTGRNKNSPIMMNPGSGAGFGGSGSSTSSMSTQFIMNSSQNVTNIGPMSPTAKSSTRLKNRSGSASSPYERSYSQDSGRRKNRK